MTNLELAEKALNIANNYKTCYMLGSWGMLTSKSNIDQAVARTDVNNAPYKSGAYNIENQGWMFDCVCLIKSILWGFSADKNRPRGGGARYGTNGVPDIGADTMIKRCLNVSTDFSNIEVGEAVWVPGHIGIYVGNSKVVECTPRWNIAPNGVKVTNLGNHGIKSGWSRTWTKHGKLPYIKYIKEDELDMTAQEFIDSLTGKQALQLLNKARIELQKLQVADDDYGKPGLDWGVQEGLMVGNESGNLMPEDFLTRKQFMTVLKRYDEKK